MMHSCSNINRSLSTTKVHHSRWTTPSRGRGDLSRARAGFLKSIFGDDAKPEPATSTAQSSAVSFPPYTIFKQTKQYDLRLYDVYPVVEVQYQRRDEGYLALGTYFDGRNSASLKFQESQPVVMRYEPGGKKSMQLHVGRTKDGTAGPFTVTELPAPSDPQVSLSIAGGEVLAVLRFEGNITPVSAEAARKQLLAALQADGLQVAEEEAQGLFRVAQYGPLFSLSTRVNEMMLRVKV